LLFNHFRAIHVMTAQSVAPRRTIMTTFTLDSDNNITAFGSKEEAAANDSTALIFTSQKELAKLAADWPAGRLIEIWNSFAGVAPFGDLKPTKKFTDRKTAIAQIWQAIQRLDAETAPVGIPDHQAKPEPQAVAAPEAATEIVPEPVAEVPAQAAEAIAQPAPDGTPNVAAATLDSSPAENAPATDQPAPKTPKRKKTAKPEQQTIAPRESKTSQMVGMLQRPEGATITEIMQRMGWLKHTVRGFMAGAMKKAGYTVESFKPEGGERSYRIPSK
jgi:hypothetical protein